MLKMKRILVICFIFLILVGCTNNKNNITDDEEFNDLMAEGVIKELYLADENTIGFYISEGNTTNKYTTAYVDITNETKIYDTELNEITANELTEGIYVEVTFYGNVSESYPPSGDASKINIINK